jgi:hypothetical protein
MDVAPIPVVFGCVIAKQTQVQKIGCAWQKFEWRKVSLVERSGIGPDPADAVLFYQPNELWPMPARVTKFNGKPEIPRQLRQEFTQRVFSVCGCQGRRELNKNHLYLWPEYFDRTEERTQLCSAISETANMGDLTWKLAGKPKAGGSCFGPATNRRFAWRGVKCRIHFNGWEIPGIKFEPMRLRQIVWIKDPAPVVEAPCARAYTYLLLIRELQMDSNINRFCV